MSSPQEAQPAKRRPGRPRKSSADEPISSSVDAPALETVPSDPTDDLIGQAVGDLRIHFVTFPDGREYRVQNGLIAERV